MITNVQVVSVPVDDQERAKTFYVDVLGFELRAEDSWGEGMRWVEVAPRGFLTSLSLVTWFGSMPPGSLQGLVVATDDIQTAYDSWFCPKSSLTAAMTCSGWSSGTKCLPSSMRSIGAPSSYASR